MLNHWLRSRSAIARWSLALLFLCLVVGIFAARTTPLDVFPEFAQPLIEVQNRGAGTVHRRGRAPGHAAA